MKPYSCNSKIRRLPLAALALTSALALAPPAVQADDRSLLEPTQKNPYVYIILDTSGSMHQEINCSGPDAAKGYCSITQVCDNGNCLPRLMGDDPDSKIYTAKQVIYNLMATHPNVNFGFGHFDQSQLRVSWKYWWYQLATGQTGILLADNTTTYPESGQQELFGKQAWNCNTASPAPFSNVGCISTQPAHLDNAWEWERARRYPKLGNIGESISTVYYFTQKSDNSLPTYRVTFAGISTMPASSMPVSVTVDRCKNSSCSSVATMGTKVLTFTLANPTIYWETGLPLNGTNIPDGSGNGGNFYSTRQINQNYNDPGSMKIEDNNDTASDQWSACATCDMQQATTADPLARSPANVFSLGDMIPLDWKNDQQTAITQRMAPNLVGGSPLVGCPAPATTPDFGIANYLADQPIGGENALRLKCSVQRPLAPDGGTPTGHVMMTFAEWLTNGTTNWPGTAFTPNAASSSWIGTASGASGDPFFACKPAYVLLLTDGLASSDDGNWDLNTSLCPQYAKWAATQSFTTKPGFACCAAEALRTITFGSGNSPYPVRTYVVGLGLPKVTLATYNNTLSCIADEGGTGLRHFIKGDTKNPFPASDPPPASFCTASNPCDGPGPFIPQNKQELADALQSVLTLIQAQASSFASAAVPSIQSNIANVSILTSFQPVNEPVWPGRVDAFINPVPTVPTNVILPDGTPAQEALPDHSTNAQCKSVGQQGCWLWNAGDQILAQGLKGFDVAGTDGTSRRIYYAPQTPIKAGEQRLFLQMPGASDTTHAYLDDLAFAMGLCPTPGDTACAAPATPPTPSVASLVQQAITFTEEIKNYTPQGASQPVQYLLGDIFHSNPQILGEPNDPTLFNGNVDNYQAFAANGQFRRKVVFFGSNDGELHAIDAGTVQLGSQDGQPAYVFTNGTGNELFAFVPRTVMPTLNSLGIANAPPAFGGKQTFMVDGQPHFAEGFFDASGGTNKQWHTLVVGGLREGGSAYYALDVTQPDALTVQKQPPDPTTLTQTNVNMPDPQVKTYLPSCINGGCGQLPNAAAQPSLPYPTPLWEFTDSCQVDPKCPSNCALTFCDEDPAPTSGKPQPGYKQPDLGQTWSTPNTGRVRICDSGCTTFHEQWVVVFGGGMAAANDNSQGNYLYMLDMATGQVIYKSRLNGSAPSEVAAIDTGQDGYIDVIYVGTTAGHLYKVDLTQPAPITTLPGLGNRVDSTVSWKPFEIFDTEGRQMYYPPAVFFIPSINKFGLAWGTGNRQDLWLTDNTTGRFYVLVDNDLKTATDLKSTSAGLPFKAANLQPLTPDAAQSAQSGKPVPNFLTAPNSGLQPGFWFELDPGERVLNEAFTLSGVLIFNSFQPKTATGGVSNTVCADSGDTRVFVLNITNGDALSQQLAAEGTKAPSGTPSNRYFISGDTLALNITTHQASPLFFSKSNPAPVPNGGPSQAQGKGPFGGDGTGPCRGPQCSCLGPDCRCLNYNCTCNGPNCGFVQCDTTSPVIQDIMVQIKNLMPSSCRFTNAWIDIILGKVQGSSDCTAAVPICTIERNWREF